MSFYKDKVQSATSLEACSSGNNGEDAVSAIKIVPVANAAAANILTISNASLGQASTLTIPDPGASTANVILSAGTQTISGAVTLSSASGLNVSGGGIISGASGTAGSLKVFPATASKGDLKITCSNQTGNTEVILNAAAMGQATTVTLGDPAVASSNLCQAPAALVNNNYVVASGTAGLLADSASGVVSVTLNTAAVTGAYATPFQIVAAPGSGKTLIVTAAAVYTNSTGQTAFATGGNAIIQYDSTVHGAGTNALSGTIAAANITAASSQILGGLLPSTTALTGVTNKGLFFSNATGAFTNGTGSSLTITIEYMILTATV